MILLTHTVLKLAVTTQKNCFDCSLTQIKLGHFIIARKTVSNRFKKHLIYKLAHLQSITFHRDIYATNLISMPCLLLDDLNATIPR